MNMQTRSISCRVPKFNSAVAALEIALCLFDEAQEIPLANGLLIVHFLHKVSPCDVIELSHQRADNSREHGASTTIRFAAEEAVRSAPTVPRGIKFEEGPVHDKTGLHEVVRQLVKGTSAA